MSGSDYKKVVSGLGGDTLALKKDGTMVEFKQNNWTTVYSFTNETESVTLPTNIIDIYAFNKTFAAIDKNNALYIWGDNSNLLTNISNKSSDFQ